METTAQQLVDRLERDGSAGLIADVAAPLPITVINNLLGHF
jgi:cytochrome P450